MIGTRQNLSLGDVTISTIDTTTDSPLPPMLFLHGWGGSAESFQLLMTELEHSLPSPRRMIALDLPGFGQSPPPPKPWSVDDYVSCVVQYLEYLGIPQVDLVVHSFGGRLTTKLAVTEPHRIRKIVYLAPAGIRGDLTALKQRQGRAQRLKRLFQNPLLRPLFPILRTLGYRLIGGQDYLAVSGVMKDTFRLVTEEDLTDFLPRITQPAQIFWGRDDSYVPVADGTYMAHVMPNANLTIFEDGRHGIHYTHAPQIAAAISQFL